MFKIFNIIFFLVLIFINKSYAEIVKEVRILNNERITKETILVFSDIKIGKNYSLYCKKKISEVVSKYAVKAISYSSNIIKRKYYYKVKLKIVLSESAGYEATGKAKLPYDALNHAIIHLSKILRRHYRKIKNENKGNKKIRLLKDSFLLYNLR